MDHAMHKGMKGMGRQGEGKPVIPAGRPSGRGSLSRKVDTPVPRAAVGSARVGGIPPQSRKQKSV